MIERMFDTLDASATTHRAGWRDEGWPPEFHDAGTTGLADAGEPRDADVPVDHDGPADLSVDVMALCLEDGPEGIPAGMDRWEPGPVLAAVLSTIDVAALSGHDRVVVLRAHQRMLSHHQALAYEAMTGVSDSLAGELDDLEVTERAAATEIRTALRLSRQAAAHQLGLAHDLHRRLPRVGESLAAGRIDPNRARVIVSATAHLDVATARQVVDAVIDRATGWTAGQLRERIRRLCIELRPDEAAERYRHAVDDRRVVTEPSPDGTVTLLGCELPADRATEAMDRLDRIARNLRTSAETRTLDQLRADVLLDLLCGTTHPDRGSVHLTVDLATLARLADHPGHLDGYGPVVAELARRTAHLLAGTPWAYSVTDSSTGQPLDHGTTRRRPTARQSRAVRARHPVCVFPGCRAPAGRSDLDHRIPWSEGGPTSEDNLAPLCRADHCTRHQTGWRYRPTPDGDFHWTSPLGHTYTTSGRDP